MLPWQQPKPHFYSNESHFINIFSHLYQIWTTTYMYQTVFSHFNHVIWIIMVSTKCRPQTKKQGAKSSVQSTDSLATIPDKTTWESFPHHVHFPTQQYYFQNDAFVERNPLPPVQCCFLQTPRDQAFFWIHNNIAFRGRGRGKNWYSYDV